MMKSERKILIIGVQAIVAIIISCIFIADWFFNRTLLTEDVDRYPNRHSSGLDWCVCGSTILLKIKAMTMIRQRTLQKPTAVGKRTGMYYTLSFCQSSSDNWQIILS